MLIEWTSSRPIAESSETHSVPQALIEPSSTRLQDREKRADVYCQLTLNHKPWESIIGASCLGFVCCICGLAESPTVVQLAVRVGSEAALTWQGDRVVLVKIRLALGTQARVWMNDSCGTPPANGHVVPASGTYTIPLGELDGFGTENVCLSSSDGTVRSVLPALGK